MDPKSANKLAATALNNELYAAFSKAWSDTRGNLAATALLTGTSYEQAGNRAYIFNIVPSGDPRLPAEVAAYGECMKDPAFGDAAATEKPVLPRSAPSWNEIISDARDIFSSLKADEKMNSQFLGQSFYQASGIGQVLDRGDILEANPNIRTRLMREIAPSLENIALASRKHGDLHTSDRLFALTAAAVSCGNERQPVLEAPRTSTAARHVQLER